MPPSSAALQRARAQVQQARAQAPQQRPTQQPAASQQQGGRGGTPTPPLLLAAMGGRADSPATTAAANRAAGGNANGVSGGTGARADAARPVTVPGATPQPTPAPTSTARVVNPTPTTSGGTNWSGNTATTSRVMLAAGAPTATRPGYMGLYGIGGDVGIGADARLTAAGATQPTSSFARFSLDPNKYMRTAMPAAQATTRQPAAQTQAATTQSRLGGTGGLGTATGAGNLGANTAGRPAQAGNNRVQQLLSLIRQYRQGGGSQQGLYDFLTGGQQTRSPAQATTENPNWSMDYARPAQPATNDVRTTLLNAPAKAIPEGGINAPYGNDNQGTGVSAPGTPTMIGAPEPAPSPATPANPATPASPATPAAAPAPAAGQPSDAWLAEHGNLLSQGATQQTAPSPINSWQWGGGPEAMGAGRNPLVTSMTDYYGAYGTGRPGSVQPTQQQIYDRFNSNYTDPHTSYQPVLMSPGYSGPNPSEGGSNPFAWSGQSYGWGQDVGTGGDGNIFAQLDAIGGGDDMASDARWLGSGEEAPAGQWMFDTRQGFINPATGPTGKGRPGQRMALGQGFDPKQRGGGWHVMASPPGVQAPVDRFNYTPSTKEASAIGVQAPVDQLNLTLMPA